jgi:DNA-3-methyladenine glycosylase I
MEPSRCPWCGSDPLYVAYHDVEWGVPLYDDRKLFELLILEGAQAGLSWLTILRKRDNYRRALDDFDPEKIAQYGPAELERLLNDAGIVRHRLKLEATIRNAQAYLRLQEEFNSAAEFFWRYGEGRPQQNGWRDLAEVPTRSPASDRMSRDLKQQGFTYVGTTICYAFMQAAGMVNDHITDCFRHPEVLGIVSLVQQA